MTAQRRRWILGALVALHMAAGPASAYLVRDSWPAANVVGFLALFLAEASLVGLWAGISESSPWRRAAIAAGGTVYLMLLPSFFAPHGAHGAELLMFAGMATISLLPGFLVATLMRRIHPGIRLTLSDERPADLRHLQVSIRFLFAFTAAVAVLLMIFQSIQEHVTSIEVAVSFVLPLSYGWICCVAAIAVLAPQKVFVSTCAAIAVCPLVGAVPSYYLGALDPKLREPTAWVLMAGADAAIIAATLLIVRWCGYRLVPREPRVEAVGDGAAFDGIA